MKQTFRKFLFALALTMPAVFLRADYVFHNLGMMGNEEVVLAWNVQTRSGFLFSRAFGAIIATPVDERNCTVYLGSIGQPPCVNAKPFTPVFKGNPKCQLCRGSGEMMKGSKCKCIREQEKKFERDIKEKVVKQDSCKK